MGLYRDIQNIKARIIDTERLLQMVKDHPIMSVGLISKIKSLQKELANLGQTNSEPKVQLLFSGGAVAGSLGIKSTFIAKTVAPFQEMVKTQFAMLRFNSVGKRGQAKSAANTELYLTALPTGSFGIELSQLETTDLFAELDVTKAIKQVIELVVNTTKSDEAFESAIEHAPKRHLTNLKKFLHEIADEHSILKMESGDLGIEISSEQVKEAYERVASADIEENEVFLQGTLRGLLLDSGKFEFQDEFGTKYSGSINSELSEEQLIAYKSLINESCKAHLMVNKTIFKTHNEKIDYELLEILSI